MKIPSPAPTSLKVTIDSKVIFQSDGKWLHPLFELEDFLHAHTYDMYKAVLWDKIIGKAAAFLIVRLGVGKVHGHVMSDLAVEVFQASATPFSYDERVNRIDCKTESILLNVDDPQEAYRILCKRAGRC